MKESSNNHDYKGIIDACGKLGEIFLWNDMRNNPYSEFVSRDLNDGFGYDMSYKLGKFIILCEVKSTTNVYGDDYFKLSDNEYSTMLSTTDNNAIYVIERVLISIKRNYCNHITLHYDKINDMFCTDDYSTAYLRRKKDNRYIYVNVNDVYED